MEFIAKTMSGLEELLAEELKNLGAKKVKALRRAASFSGDLETLYRVNYCSRLAIRVLKQSYSFKAQNEKELYDAVRQIAWEDHFDVDETFSIDPVVNSDLFQHSKYISLKMKDAIVDRFRKQLGRRPDVDTQEADFPLHLHIFHDTVNISIDSSGESLHKRGYRSSGHAAPLNEILAAGMVMLSGWTKYKVLLDPMCGSGTIPIEAGMIASHTPPQLLRKDFAFMRWKDYDSELWESVKNKANSQIDKQGIEIKASDRSGIHVRLARTAAEALGLENVITFEREDFFERDEEDAYLIMNPPYGERMDDLDIETFYEEMADHLKRYMPGCQCWLISSNNEALLRFGLRPSRRIKLYNGKLECLFQQFELYKGSKKAKFQEGHIDRLIEEMNPKSKAENQGKARNRYGSDRLDSRSRESRKSESREGRQEKKPSKSPYSRGNNQGRSEGGHSRRGGSFDRNKNRFEKRDKSYAPNQGEQRRKPFRREEGRREDSPKPFNLKNRRREGGADSVSKQENRNPEGKGNQSED